LNYSGKVLKVAQFAGYVAEHSNYHHGEKNLIDTIIKLAQRFIGSNNMPLFFEDGNFGSRLQMGKDAADGRYIHTKLDSTTRYLFREEDDAYLPDNYDEGEKIEKEYYLPIVPTILVNGCGGGIGTGWSCTVPSYNIKEIVEWIKEWMMNGDDIECNINPWFFNFKGSIEVNDKKIVTKGVYTQTDNIVVVTEIPIGKKNIGIKKYKETLEELYDQKKISDLRDDSTDDEIYFRFKVDEEFEVSHESLGLVDCLFTSNMVLFDSNGKIKKYDAVKDILVEFCNKRRELYDIRKREQIKEMEEELKYLRNKIRFIGDIIENRIQLKNRTDESLQTELGEKKFDRKEDSYDYLLSIQIRACTGQRLDDLMKKEKEIVQGLEAYRKKSIEMIWSEELDELIQKYNQWMKEQEQHTSSNEEDHKMPKKKIVNKKK
jgi:DNA topoisomerase II